MNYQGDGPLAQSVELCTYADTYLPALNARVPSSILGRTTFCFAVFYHLSSRRRSVPKIRCMYITVRFDLIYSNVKIHMQYLCLSSGFFNALSICDCNETRSYAFTLFWGVCYPDNCSCR